MFIRRTPLEQKWPWAGVRARLPAFRWLAVPTVAFTISRLVVVVALYLGTILIPDNSSPPLYHLRPPNNVFMDALGSRWDTGFYLSIAGEGYRFTGVPLPSVAFFPLYPMLIRITAPLVGGDHMLAGIIISNLALFLAAAFFYQLVRAEWGDRVAARAVWYMLIFPAAFFGSAIYSESLFLLVSIGALFFARRGQWAGAAVCAVAATLTRLVGLIVVPMLLAEWWRQHRHGEQGVSWWALLAPVVAPSGTGAYMLYLQRTFGDALAFIHASAAWNRVPQSPLVMLSTLWQKPVEGWMPALLAAHIHIDNWTDLTFVVLFLLLSLFLLVEQRWSEGLFVFLGALIPLNSGLLMSQRRYVWVLFPAYILLARLGKRDGLDRAIMLIFVTGLVLFTALFANGYWVG